MWLPGAGVGGDYFTAKNAKDANPTTKGTKFTKFKSINIRTFVFFVPSW